VDGDGREFAHFFPSFDVVFSQHHAMEFNQPLTRFLAHWSSPTSTILCMMGNDPRAHGKDIGGES
jgi:hypothetical protein